MRVHVFLALTVALGFLTGCGRAPSPASTGDTYGLPREISFTDHLAALTNVALFAEAPLGQAGMLTHSGAGIAYPASNVWVEVARLEGPGCVTRLWSDAAAALRWRFYFDDEPLPRLELGTTELFGGQFPFADPLAESVSAGRISYVPLPYDQSLRIMIGGGEDEALAAASVQVGYSSYDPLEVRVASFPDVLSAAQTAAVEVTRRAWRDVAAGLHAAGERCGTPEIHRLHPGDAVEWLNEQGEGIVTAFRIFLHFPDQSGVLERTHMLRALTLRFTWDESGHASVDVPLGDFFANAMRSRRFASLPAGYVDGWYISRWPMPFKQSARAELRNDGTIPVKAHIAYRIEDARLPEEVNYFHASWRQQLGKGEDHEILNVRGTGHLAGAVLNITGMEDNAWPLFEASELIAPDDSNQSVWRGGGLAAAFNGGGYFSGLYDRPLAGLVETAPVRAQAYRWFLPDRVRFKDSMNYSWSFADAPPVRLSAASTVYWYQSRPQAVPALPPLRARRPPADPLVRQSIMCALIELERIGHDDEARDLAIEFYERFPGTVTADFLRVRALAYEERLSGHAVVRDLYRDILERVRGTALGRELARKIWFHTAKDNGLLATQINGRFRAYLNGERIEQGDNPTTLVARPVRLRPGTNELTVKVIPNKPDAWMSLFLRTHYGDIVSGADWEYAREKPSDWPSAACPETRWYPVAKHGQFPLPRWWRLTPNVFPHMQSGRQLAIPWRGTGWSEPPFEETYFRKTFVMPENMPVSGEPLPEPAEILDDLLSE